MSERPFFVGYVGLPRGSRGFAAALAVVLVLGAGLLATMVARSVDDPGPGAFRFDLGPQKVTGIVELTPAPVLHVTEGTSTIAPGHTLMLSGQGKNGALPRARALEGRLATASGILLTRGTLDMLQIGGGEAGLGPATGASAPALPAPEPLGRWALAGEICDGKCASGAMLPGLGIAHKACANLCILNGLPPVFVSTRPVAGASFLLIAGTAEAPMPPELYDWVGEYVTLEGLVRRHGDLLVLTVDPATLERAP
ncbi:hypothetical protein OCH239_12900 [Roseivivax halodurans JCM 10272]|uniref:Uncharacterized protein n=1 Tax=Roseivivax halodurans JCM 10272 TaxID=1449350 RepID=X7EBG4_9RHOB|nr:hypothetical protein [Roseivivax halodurans]ETX13215.1 hypothetical protein OCH239_12900 [Roseivivax halodurans JCM 10272]